MDICAFTNTNGGTIYVGVPADPHKAPIGVSAPKSAMDAIRKAVQKQITPPIEITLTPAQSPPCVNGCALSPAMRRAHVPFGISKRASRELAVYDASGKKCGAKVGTLQLIGGGKSELASIVPGQPDKSELILRLPADVVVLRDPFGGYAHVMMLERTP